MNLIEEFQNSSALVKVIALILVVAIMAVCCWIGWILWPTGSGGPETMSSESRPVFVTVTPNSAIDSEAIANEPVVLPTPISFSGWRGEYFDNPNLEGEPVHVRDDEFINFDWGESPPAPDVPAANFSARWTISRDNVAAGIYRFTGRFDNGMRVWLDDVLIIDQWYDGPLRDVSVYAQAVAGSHTVKVEYYHLEGPAVAQLKIEDVQNFPNWKAEYFDQPNFNNPPVLVSNEKEINYNWGAGSPAPGIIPDNNFAVSWTRSAYVDEGTYKVIINVEGGVRLWIDGQVVLDSWSEKGFRQVEATTKLAQGDHGFKVEYFKETGNGQISTRYLQLQEPDEPPLAVITGRHQTQTGQAITLSGKFSSPAEGSQLASYDWDMGDGSQANGRDVSHTYNTTGEYEVKLTVTDNKGLNDTTTHQVTVQEATTETPDQQAPQPIIQGPSQAKIGEIITLDGSQSICSGRCVDHLWNMADGSQYRGVTVQHAYVSPAAYVVSLTVTDDQGRQSMAVKQIAVKKGATPTPEATPTPAPEAQPLSN
jgi:chitodextrinase